MKKAIYPFKYMRITQRHDEGNHLPHWKPLKDWGDKPWDEACKDGGRSYFEPKNDFVIEEIRMSAADNSIRIKSVEKLQMPYKTDYLYMTLTHMNNDDMSKLKKGQIIKAGSKIIREGTHGNSSGNHFHLTANVGKYYGFKRNSNGKWVFAYAKSLTPEEAFYLDTNHTEVLNAKGYKFKKYTVLTPVKRDKTKEQIEVIVSDLNVRDKPNGKILGYATKGIYNVLNVKTDTYTWYEVEKGKWFANNGKWVNVLAVDKPIEPPKEEKPKEPELEKTIEIPQIDDNLEDTIEIPIIEKPNLIELIIKIFRKIKEILWKK